MAAKLTEAPPAGIWTTDEAGTSLELRVFSNYVTGADFPVRRPAFVDDCPGRVAELRQALAGRPAVRVSSFC